MKNKLFIILSLFCVAACTGNKTTSTWWGNDSIVVEGETIRFDSLTFSKTKYLKDPGQPPSISVETNIKYIAGESPLAKAINAQICQFLFYKEDITLKEAMKESIDSMFTTFDEEILTFYEEEDSDFRDKYNFAYDLNGKVHYNSLKGVIVYESEIYAYEGGAHGGFALKYLNIDAKTGNPIRFKDVFQPNKEDELLSIIRKQLMDDNDCESWEELADSTGIGMLGDVYAVEGNFALHENGVEFLYNQYAIAPYACGIICVTIPYNKLQGIITLNRNNQK